MAEAASRERWQIASAQMALTANLNRDPKKHRPFKPDDFNPYRQQTATRPEKADISILKALLPNPNGT